MRIARQYLSLNFNFRQPLNSTWHLIKKTAQPSLQKFCQFR